MTGQQDPAKASRNLAAWLGLSTTHYFFLELCNKMEEKQRAKEIPKNKKKIPSIPGTFKHSLHSHGKEPEISAGAWGPERPQTTLARSRNAAATSAYPITQARAQSSGWDRSHSLSH